MASQKENIIKDSAEKKVIIFGLKEKNIILKFKRDKKEANNIKEILKTLNDEEEQKFEEEIEEIQRMERYEEGKTRPQKLRLESQAVTEEILARAFTLKRAEEYNEVYIKKSMNEEERQKLKKKLQQEVKQKMKIELKRTRRIFFWRVLDDKLKKWYIRTRD